MKLCKRKIKREKFSMSSGLRQVLHQSRNRFCTKVPAVHKAIACDASLNGSLKFKFADGDAVLTAKIHPRGSGATIPAEATIFVAKPPASDLSADHYEIIAHWATGADGKLKLTKYSCIHPDRPLSTPEKLCGNCPRRDLLK